MKNSTKLLLLALRIAIGWHFLVEGVTKLMQPGWSAEAYLQGSYGFLSGFYQWMAADPALLQVIDFLNIWGMILIGSGLFLGLFIRVSAWGGILLLALYYLAYPPFGNAYAGSGPDGHFWIVNRNLLEMFMLLLIIRFPQREYSLERLRSYLGKRRPSPSGEQLRSRRELIKGLATLPVFGGMLIGTAARARERHTDVLSGATITLKKADISELKGELPKGKLGEMEVSRLIMGHNLIWGTAHARDLHYVRQLLLQYNTEERIFQTFSLAEQAGINMINLTQGKIPLFHKYREMTGSRMKCLPMINLYMEGEDKLRGMKRTVDLGVETIYAHGAHCDNIVRNGRTEILHEAVEYIRSQGCSAGIGAHSIEVIRACEESGLKPDYYMKTMHHDNYWSAHPREQRKEFQVISQEYTSEYGTYHDNMFDLFPEETNELVNRLDVPVIGYKVLAAGAILPEDGFRYAFENGADFICVGMMDFQVVEDVNLVTEILNGPLDRKRPWFS